MMRTIPVILAGGIGERFWPLSRSSHPKQLLPLTSRRTMIEETFGRARALQTRGVVPLVMTGKPIASRMKALLSGKRRYDLIVEPVGKNTAPALALAASWIESRYGESIMVVLPADHRVKPTKAFVKAVRYACFLADAHNRLVVFGIRPTRPETGYGYLLLGKETSNGKGVKSHAVSRFIEKPDAALAARCCGSSSYRWNSGMFVWKTSVFLQEVKAHMPGLFSLAGEAARGGFSLKAIDRFYRAAGKESVDYGIMEHSRRVSAVTGVFQWDDIGSWDSLARISRGNKAGTVLVGDRIFEQGCSKSIIVNPSSHALAVIDCPETAVVATDDAILVIARSSLPDLKRYLAEMKKSGKFPSRLF
ncbi:MAG: sugar phosphate nucleotidyltransferase [Chitinispirillaceae bacterium]|jgi:mannose-1-phosphate guanylyltransferase